MTTELDNRLKRTQRQMLRMILHAPRRRNNTCNNNNDDNTTSHHNPQQPQPQPQATDNTTDIMTTHSDDDDDVDSTTSNNHNDIRQAMHSSDDDGDEMEPWVDFIRRCTHNAEMRMQALKLDDWVTLQRQRKWRWARKVTAQAANADWMPMTMRWDPTINHRLDARRRQGRPRTRWCDDLRRYVAAETSNSNPSISDDRVRDHMFPMPADNQQWQQLAHDEAKWSQMERGFCQR